MIFVYLLAQYLLVYSKIYSIEISGISLNISNEGIREDRAIIFHRYRSTFSSVKLSSIMLYAKGYNRKEFRFCEKVTMFCYHQNFI
jgi:hypothetical protein